MAGLEVRICLFLPVVAGWAEGVVGLIDVDAGCRTNHVALSKRVQTTGRLQLLACQCWLSRRARDFVVVDSSVAV